VLTRRRFLAAAAGAGLAIGAGGIGVDRLLADDRNAPVVLGPPVADLPPRQHAWNDALAHDPAGNPVAARHARLLMLDLAGAPDAERTRRLEASLRTLEHEFPRGPEGLLFTLGWGPQYFEQALGITSPVPHPRALSDFELPTLDAYDACLHLTANDAARLETVTNALFGDGSLPGGVSVDLRSVFRLRETRTGFVGAGLPAAHQRVAGIPSGKPVEKSSPLFMGFHSGFGRNQATENDVTIADGELAGGTTMHVSRMRLRLGSWYEILDERERTARMFGPDVTPAQVAQFTTDAASNPDRFAHDATTCGVVGHAQTAARARRDNRAIIIRRDFDTVDGDEAGLHFVSLQRSIDDFVKTRTAMNAARAATLNPAITSTVNNGINEFIFVTHRANYAVPSRDERSFPLWPGRKAALT
jgi:hypothetical protein